MMQAKKNKSVIKSKIDNDKKSDDKPKQQSISCFFAPKIQPKVECIRKKECGGLSLKRKLDDYKSSLEDLDEEVDASDVCRRILSGRQDDLDPMIEPMVQKKKSLTPLEQQVSALKV